MALLAFYTCGMLRGSIGSNQVAGFFNLAPAVFESAAKAPGCVRHMMDEPRGWPPAAQEWGPWGTYSSPDFHNDVPGRDDRVAATLSVWESIAAVRAFAYSGVHAQALAQRSDWFEQSAFPGYVMWWIDDGDVPTWKECARRMQDLHENGPSTNGFTFAKVFPQA
jgi:hypothetical protein